MEFWITKAEREELLNIQKKMKNSEKSLRLYLEILPQKKITNPTSKIKNEIESKIHYFAKEESLISTIAQILLYKQLGFDAKIESLISSYMNNEQIYYYFKQENFLDLNEKINKKIIQDLLFLMDNYKPKKQLEVFLAHISYNLGKENRDLIVDEFEIPNKLSFVQDRIKSITYGTGEPQTWVPWIEKYSSTEELEVFLERTFIYRKIKNNPSQLSLLRSLYPLESEKRKIIMNGYNELLASNDIYLQDIAYRLFSNIFFLNDFKKIKKSKPVFLLKRNHFRKLLSQNTAILYSIFNLYELGDFEREYFIKSLAVQSYGL